MEIEKVKIVADSSADMTELRGIPFAVAPLKIVTAQKEYVDDVHLDVAGMVNDLHAYKGRSSSSCPNPEEWIRAFGDAEWVFCLTITATLSGSYNAAMVAKAQYEEAHPDRRVFVLNSLSTGPEMGLMIEKLCELILAGMDFDTVCEELTAYTQKTGLLFMLESMKNLANNGRVSPLVAKVADLLGIRVAGKASDKGDLEMLSKTRGEKKALEVLAAHMKALGYRGGKVRIAHCLNEGAAKNLRDLIRSEFEAAQVAINACRGLCSFYAERGGLLVGFEKG